jgi:hypothetical protein
VSASYPEAADPSGFDIMVVGKEAGVVFYTGTWAVTAQ